jgi:hypothetical protein
VRGRVILNSVNSSGCVSTSMDPACNDDIIADREAQPSALTGRLGREECGVPVVTMTSGSRRTKSATKAGSVALCPSILDCNVHAFEHVSFRQLRTSSGCCRHVRSGGAAAGGSELLEMIENIRPSLHEPHALPPIASPSWKHVRQTPDAAPLAHINRDY